MTSYPRFAFLALVSFALAAILAAGGLPAAAGLAADGEGSAPSKNGTPRIASPEARKRLPDAVQGEIVSVAFEIRNDGDAPLEIDRVEAGTEGLVVLSAPERLAPGESGRITAQKRLGPRDEGPGRLIVAVFSNDPNTPRMDLVAELTAKVFVEAKPGSARWIYVQGEPEGTIVQTIASRDGRPFRVVDLENPQAGLSLSVEPAPETAGAPPGTRWLLRMTLDEKAPVGPVEGSVVVHLDHPEQKRLEIPVSGFVRPALAVTPEAVRFGEVALDEPVVQAFRVQVFTTRRIEIEGVTHDLPGVGPARIEALSPGRSYRIELTFGPEVPKGPLRGEIRIRTDSELAPLVTIPVHGTIQ